MKLLNNFSLKIFSVLLTLFSTSCSLVSPKNQNISIVSDPSGAKVSINGAYIGVTPTSYSVRRDEPVSVLVAKEGYEAAVRSLDSSFSTTGILDIVGGCIWLVPFFGLLAPGAKEIDNPNVSVVLSEKEVKSVDKNYSNSRR
jgi:hypothetical protein